MREDNDMTAIQENPQQATAAMLKTQFDRQRASYLAAPNPDQRLRGLFGRTLGQLCGL